MKHSHKKSFDWYSMQQRYSIRKYHFGAASVLLGTALVLGTAANAQAVQAEEHNPEATNSVSVDKVEEATKPAEVATPKKETTYAAPTVANPVETTPAKTEEATKPAEKVEEAKDKKEEVKQQDAVDKSKLLTALSRAEKLELKLYTEDSVKRLQTSIQSAKGLLNKADVAESELSQAESDLQAAVIALELRGTTTTKVADKIEVVSKIESAEKKNTESKVAEKTSEVDKESVEKDKTALKPVKGLRVEDAKANIKGGWNIPLDQEASLRLKSAIEAHAAQGSSRRRKRAIGDLDYTFKKVMTPVNPGFYADAKSVDELTVNPDYINETVVNVWYKDLGYINLVDKDGHYINSNGEVVENKEDAIRRQYKNDFNDTTRADVTEIPQAPVGWKISDNQSIRGYDAETKTIDPNDDSDLDAVGKDSNVVIEKENQKAVIRYVSTNGNRVLTTDEVTGKSGEAIAYSTTSQINEFKKQGYKLVSDEFTSGGAKVYDYDTARDQVYTVTLSERIERVTPKDPKPQPNTPVNPGQPNTPNWPGTVERMEKLTQTISRRINFRYLKNGKAAYGTIDQHISYERNALVNLVSGDIHYEQWKITGIKNQDVVAPVASQPSVTNNGESRVARSSRSRRALSEVAPVSENLLATQVNNSQVSPVGLTVTENGERSVRRSSRGKRAAAAKPDSSTNSEANSSVNAVFKAVRTPVTPKFYATVNKVGTMEVNPNSPQDTEVNVDLKEMGRIVAVNNKGQYINKQGEVVQNIEDALYKYYDNDPNDATKAAETKIPEAPKFHVLNNEQPTVWGYNIVDKTIEPNDESDPDRIGKDTFVTYNEIIDSLTKETEQTVSFTGAGSATPKDNVQNDFVFKGSYNEATKETTWENKDHTYGTVKVPVVTGYFADKAEAGAKTVTPDLPKATDTVTYKALGKIIPVDASGNVIANAPQPQYLNDANDPRKAGETAVPEIVGYKPERTSVTPENPGEDTKVTYVKTDQVAVVRYIDVDNKDEVVHTDNITGKSGEKIAYTTETVLKSLLEKGYLLHEDGFPADATFDTDETKVQEYTVLLKHKITVKKDAPKLVERTIHYVFEDGTKASEDHHEQVSFSRMLSIDNVTGKTTSTSWASEDGVTGFDEVVSPTIAGYTPDLAKVAAVQGITAETENQVITVTYRNVQPIPQVTPTPIPTPTPTPQVTPDPVPTSIPTPQVTPTPVPTPTPAPNVPSAVPTSNSTPKEEKKELPKTAGHSSGMAQVLGVLGLIAGFSLVGKAKRDE